MTSLPHTAARPGLLLVLLAVALLIRAQDCTPQEGHAGRALGPPHCLSPSAPVTRPCPTPLIPKDMP
ncbi:hypothetical protein [Dinoroseobacter sp. S76]|uniref:hypothetical protein n=1 Tax=Dinoroseobacter sp. S76 TaxID=3415124 RepID=UPI003C79E3B0